MGFEGAFQLAELVVPDFDGAVFAAGGEGAEERVEGDAGDGEAVGLEGVSGRGAGEPDIYIYISVLLRMARASVWIGVPTKSQDHDSSAPPDCSASRYPAPAADCSLFLPDP